jgi:hypothetical protein
MGSENDNLNMPTHERIESPATSQSSACRFQDEGAAGQELGQQGLPVSMAQAWQIVEQWPEASKKPGREDPRPLRSAERSDAHEAVLVPRGEVVAHGATADEVAPTFRHRTPTTPRST